MTFVVAVLNWEFLQLATSKAPGRILRKIGQTRVFEQGCVFWGSRT